MPSAQNNLWPAKVVIATMHGREAVIAPLIADQLGIETWTPADFDTDAFGTFTRKAILVYSSS